MELEKVRSKDLFVFYSRQDEKLWKILEVQLDELENENQLSGRYLFDIGDDVECNHEANLHLDTAEIILMLISPKFLASKFFKSVEMMRAIERHQAEEALVIPIVVRAVSLKDTPFADLLVLPSYSQPYTSSRDRGALLDIMFGIKNALVPFLLKKAKRDKEKFMNNGDILYNLQEYDKALLVYKEANSIDPSDVVVYLKMGQTLHKKRAYDEAIAVYNKACNLDPNSINAWIGIGEIENERKKFHEALPAFENVIKIDPNNATAHLSKANVLVKLRRYQEALSAYNRATLLDPDDANAWHGKGDTLKRIGRKAEAEKAYGQAQQLGFIAS
ncbi:MAG: tetratricopeptide repeat protein [Ktedonobacteraceae bacterium]